MYHIRDFEPQFAGCLPDTHTLLASANLVVHSAVSRLVLHGSRGLAGGYRPDSDIDLSLIVDLPPEETLDSVLHEISEMTLSHWQGPIEVDLAVIFDIRNCTLRCFDQTTWDRHICQLGGVDCFGLYKTQRGFNGRVTHAGIQVKLMYPCLKIWQRK